jgi:hypothetical protein
MRLHTSKAPHKYPTAATNRPRQHSSSSKHHCQHVAGMHNEHRACSSNSHNQESRSCLACSKRVTSKDTTRVNEQLGSSIHHQCRPALWQSRLKAVTRIEVGGVKSIHAGQQHNYMMLPVMHVTEAVKYTRQTQIHSVQDKIMILENGCTSVTAAKCPTMHTRLPCLYQDIDVHLQ